MTLLISFSPRRIFNSIFLSCHIISRLDFLSCVDFGFFQLTVVGSEGRENLQSEPVTRPHDLWSPIKFSSQSISPPADVPTADSEPGSLLFSFAVRRTMLADSWWPLRGAQRAQRRPGSLRAGGGGGGAPPSSGHSPALGPAAPITHSGKMTKMRRNRQLRGAKEEAGGQKPSAVHIYLLTGKAEKERKIISSNPLKSFIRY